MNQIFKFEYKFTDKNIVKSFETYVIAEDKNAAEKEFYRAFPYVACNSVKISLFTGKIIDKEIK
jgi:hypothetical protein